MQNIRTKVWGNGVDPYEAAPKGAVWSWSTLFVILSVLSDTSKDSQTDLVKFYVKYLKNWNIFNYGLILHKNVKKRNPTHPTIFKNMLP